MIQDVLNQIKRTTNLNTNLFQQNLFITNYLNRLFNVQSSLKNFESNLENTRSAVLNSTRRLKLDEVNELTTALGEIGRESVELKGLEVEINKYLIACINCPPLNNYPTSINYSLLRKVETIITQGSYGM